jgi:hypothetical protein
VRFGVDILESRELPSVDPYSFTQDRPWINHEWLSEVFMGAAWAGGGTAGLALLKAMLALSTLLIVWRAHRDADLGLRMAVLAGTAVAAAQITQTLRPQLWSLLGIALLTAELQFRGARRPWLFLPLFCVWANAHGGWIVGLAVTIVWAAVETARDRSSLRAWALALAAAVAGTLLTPYSWRLWTFMIETVRLSRPQIEDWSPLWEVGPAKWLLWGGVVAWIAWLWPKLSRSRMATVVVLIVLAAASVRVVRILPLFGVAAAILLAPAVAAWRPRRPLTPLRPREEGVAAALIAAACLAGAIWIGATSFRCIGVDVERMPEAAVVRALAQAPPGRLVTFFDWGEYAIWHLYPSCRVSIDGRYSTAYPPEVIERSWRFMTGAPGWDEILADASIALVGRRQGVAAKLAADRGWREVHADPTALVFVREGTALPEPLAVLEPSIGLSTFP